MISSEGSLESGQVVQGGGRDPGQPVSGSHSFSLPLTSLGHRVVQPVSQKGSLPLGYGREHIVPQGSGLLPT